MDASSDRQLVAVGALDEAMNQFLEQERDVCSTQGSTESATIKLDPKFGVF